MPRILRITALTVVALLACVTAPGHTHAVLERVLRPCGYTDSLGNDYFYIRDYLGNVRSVIDDEGYLVEINDYYPYGALMNTLADNPTRQPYKYGGKELDRIAGLDLYDSRARQYDPILGRTTSPDPRSSSYSPLSHYVWCAGTPVNAVDPDGQYVESIWDIYNVVLGAKSAIENFSAGNIGYGFIDLGGTLIDVAAVVAPGVPAGVSTGIKAARTGEKLLKEAGKTAVHASVSGSVKAAKKEVKKAAKKGVKKSR